MCLVCSLLSSVWVVLIWCLRVLLFVCGWLKWVLSMVSLLLLLIGRWLIRIVGCGLNRWLNSLLLCGGNWCCLVLLM